MMIHFIQWIIIINDDDSSSMMMIHHHHSSSSTSQTSSSSSWSTFPSSTTLLLSSLSSTSSTTTLSSPPRTYMNNTIIHIHFFIDYRIWHQPELWEFRCSWFRRLSSWNLRDWIGFDSSRRPVSSASCRWKASPGSSTGNCSPGNGAARFCRLIPELWTWSIFLDFWWSWRGKAT